MTGRTVEAIAHVNALTRRWLARRGPEAGVVSGLGVWPLLAFLADAADGPGRTELADALGVPADDAAEAARAVFDVVASIPAAAMALGLWTKSGLPMRQDWLAKLPEATHGELTGDTAADQKRLDAWASEHTRGMVPKFPLALNPLTVLAIASALCVETEWADKFETGRTGGQTDDLWHGGGLRLTRSTGRLGHAAVATTPIGPVTTLNVVGGGGVDVHLVLGPEAVAPGEVLAAGVDVVGRTVASVTADRLPLGTPGPGISVEEREAKEPGDVLVVDTVGFRIEADHDLMADPDVFGLAAVSQGGRGHFPGMSPAPLFVGQAKQSAVAEFGAEGFRASAVTAVAMAFGMARPMTRYQVRRVAVRFDRPFAYYAVHRDSGLILVAGWVSEPVEYATSE
jgi:serine protease inhibitor